MLKNKDEITKCWKTAKPIKHKLPNYSPLSILLRMLFHGVLTLLMIKYVSGVLDVDIGTETIDFAHYFEIYIIFLGLGEALILSDILLEYFFPVPFKIRLRVLIQIALGLLLVYAAINLRELLLPDISGIQKTGLKLGFGMGVMFSTLLSIVLVNARLTEKWVHIQNQMDKMKADKLKSDYNHLQDQLNPHFLFNNLSVLKSLIMYDKEGAIMYTENFTDVYRYVLRVKDKSLLKVADELEFIKAYLNLHEQRLGKGLQVNIEISEQGKVKEIPPLTLQLLVENAIKHNIASKQNPLTIKIYDKPNGLVVENSINLKESSYSTHTGLGNLIKRYELLSSEEVKITSNEALFKVEVPLM